MTGAERSPILFARSLFLPADLGGNRYPYEVVSRLGRRGHPVTVVTPRLHGRFPALANVRYHHYPVVRRHPLLTHATNLLAGALALRAEREACFPVALAGSYDAALALAWAGLVPHAPLVFSFHSEFYSEWVQALGRGWRSPARRAIRAYMAAIERRVFSISARLVAVSEFSARQMRERAPWVGERIRVIPTGVDTAYFTPAEQCAEVRRAAGYGEDELVVLGVGRLVAVKQLDRLIEGFAAWLHDGGPPARLVVAGDGPERAALERLAARLGIADRVSFAGFCDPPKLRALMQAADVQVCSSAFENLSLAILEGMACGTPVLGTPGGGTPEIVGAVDGSLVLPDDRPASIAEALQSLAGDRQRLGDLGQRARALVVDRYDWERVVDQLESTMQEVTPGWA